MEENKQQADGPYGSNQLFIFKAFIIFILGSLSLYIYIYWLLKVKYERQRETNEGFVRG